MSLAWHLNLSYTYIISTVQLPINASINANRLPSLVPGRYKSPNAMNFAPAIHEFRTVDHDVVDL